MWRAWCVMLDKAFFHQILDWSFFTEPLNNLSLSLLFFSLYLSLCLSLALSVSLSGSLMLSLSPSLSNWLSLSISLTLSLSLLISLSLQKWNFFPLLLRIYGRLYPCCLPKDEKAAFWTLFLLRFLLCSLSLSLSLLKSEW